MKYLSNIIKTKHDTFKVQVGDKYLGTFKCPEKAIKVRDDERKKRGMTEVKP
jgi:hypothetical protein